MNKKALCQGIIETSPTRTQHGNIRFITHTPQYPRSNAGRLRLLRLDLLAKIRQRLPIAPPGQGRRRHHGPWRMGTICESFAHGHTITHHPDLVGTLRRMDVGIRIRGRQQIQQDFRLAPIPRTHQFPGQATAMLRVRFCGQLGLHGLPHLRAITRQGQGFGGMHGRPEFFRGKPITQDRQTLGPLCCIQFDQGFGLGREGQTHRQKRRDDQGPYMLLHE